MWLWVRIQVLFLWHRTAGNSIRRSECLFSELLSVSKKPEHDAFKLSGSLKDTESSEMGHAQTYGYMTKR